MTSSVTSAGRVIRRVAGVLGASAVLLLGSSAVPATAGPRESDLVGTWDVLVTIHISDPPQFAHLDCVLSADHLVLCHSKPGLPALEGRGIWNKSRGNSFGFWITHHEHLDANGNPVGSIYAIHLGTFTRKRFTTNAFTYIDFHDGSPWIGPVPVESTAFRED